MQKFTNVQSATKPTTVEKNISSFYVYVRSNIKEDVRVIGEQGETATFYIYDEIQYTKDEYAIIEATNNNLEQDLLIVELYETLIAFTGTTFSTIKQKQFNNSLVNTYVRLINSGLKSIEDVPEFLKEEVLKFI